MKNNFSCRSLRYTKVPGSLVLGTALALALLIQPAVNYAGENATDKVTGNADSNAMTNTSNAIHNTGNAQAKQMFTWPKNAQAAVSLAYDDALDSQLDNAVPALNRYGFKATFYPTLASLSMQERLAAWRQIALQGHELGNHTVYHPCRASLPGREWVAPFHDLDKQSVAQIVQEVALANTFLQAIDGEHERTFNVPCGDSEAGGESYLEQVKPLFAGIKADSRQGRESIPGNMEVLDIHASLVWSPTDVSGAELIAHVKKSAELGSLASITFHGIGGDYLAVSREAHAELLAYLADNPQTYWVDTFLNISRHVTAQQQLPGAGSPLR